MHTQIHYNTPTTVLLTGSVIQSHPGIAPSGLQDTKERLMDYLCAIPLWLAQPDIDHVVYCDAGGFQIPDGIFENPKFESLSIDLTQLCKDRGKGSAETASIEHAMEHSRFLGNDFFKCTGRLFVKNFSEILNEITPIQPYFYLSKNHAIQWADTRLFWIDRHCFFTALKPFLDKMNDHQGRIAEFIYYYHGQEYRQLPIPVFMGRSGHSGAIYEDFYSLESRERANWRGTYRGYDYFVSGRVTGNCELHIGVTVFKHFNFDQDEEYGTIFNIVEATGNNLQGLYHAGIAMPFHIWSRMGSLCIIDTITGEITVQGNSTWWDNDYIIPNLPGYRAIWLIP